MNVLSKLKGSKKMTLVIIIALAEVAIAMWMPDETDKAMAIKEQLMQWLSVLGVGGAVGQGIADHGKEKAKVEADAAAPAKKDK